MFIPHLAIENDFFIGLLNKFLYDVKSKAQFERCVPYGAFAHSVLNGQFLYVMAPLL